LSKIERGGTIKEGQSNFPPELITIFGHTIE
jgi:hypothetical protein